MKYNTDDIITIKVDNHLYGTIIDNNGIQRFIANDVLVYLLSNSPTAILNDIALEYQYGKITKQSYQEFHMLIGYSVCGFQDLWPDVNIENPMWDSQS